MNKKTFKKIYPNESYFKYKKNIYLRNLRKYTYGWIYPSYLCIRFPFLYPKNRFTDKHYNNWKLQTKIMNIYKKWEEWSRTHVQDYINKFGHDCVFMDDSIVKSEYVMKLADTKDKFLYNLYSFIDKCLWIFHFIPTYTELDAIPTGWRKRFGIQFCKELKEAILLNPDKHYMRDFRITQIKEKFGELRCYVNLHSPEVSRVINKYEYISQFVCINCGKDAVKRTLGWISPYCEKCLPENSKWVWIDPIYGWEDGKLQEENKKIMGELP